ncbi:MAG TPA: hypothetical protein VFW62_02125 [bacterium]|nr:hypothetical protein [bacterium]
MGSSSSQSGWGSPSRLIATGAGRDVKASLLSAQTELAETHHLLDIANLELAFFQDDADSDGVLTVLDQCSGTPGGLAVDKEDGIRRGRFLLRLGESGVNMPPETEAL